jgi:hypothetical protein
MLRKRREPGIQSIAMTLLWFGLATASSFIIWTASEVTAHSWYPQPCCGGQDCRKVDKIDFLPDGDMVMHVGWMAIVVPHNFARQPSQDADAHVCISFATGTFRPVCVFMPGTS